MKDHAQLWILENAFADRMRKPRNIMAYAAIPDGGTMPTNAR